MITKMYRSLYDNAYYQTTMPEHGLYDEDYSEWLRQSKEYVAWLVQEPAVHIDGMLSGKIIGAFGKLPTFDCSLFEDLKAERIQVFEEKKAIAAKTPKTEEDWRAWWWELYNKELHFVTFKLHYNYSWKDSESAIVEMHKYERYIAELRKKVKPKRSKIVKTNSFSLKQIAIAYCAMNITITIDNAKDILAKHSDLISTEKLIQKRYTKLSDTTKLLANKTANTKHLKDLEAAKRLIIGIKDKEALGSINNAIAVFKTNYEAQD